MGTPDTTTTHPDAVARLTMLKEAVSKKREPEGKPESKLGAEQEDKE